MIKVLWFSRHDMLEDQKKELQRIYGKLQITQINRSINSAYELKEEIDASDVIAIVAPINLQSQFLKIAGENKPVISAKLIRKLIPVAYKEDEVSMVFDHWYRIKKIDVVIEKL